jgi:hypothetical protein
LKYAKNCVIISLSGKRNNIGLSIFIPLVASRSVSANSWLSLSIRASNSIGIAPFELKLNGVEKPRYLRPDLVLKEKEYQIESYYIATPRLLEGKSAFKVKLVNESNFIKKYPGIYKKYKDLSVDTQLQGTFGHRIMFSENLEYFKQILPQALHLL